MTAGPEDTAAGGVPADVAKDLVRAADRSLSTVVSFVDRDLKTRWVSRSARQIPGFDPDSRAGRLSYERIHPDDVEQLLHGMAQLQAARPGRTPGVAVPEPLRFRWQAPNGEWVTVEAVVLNMLEDPEVEGMVLVQRLVDGPRGGLDHVVELLVGDAPLPEVLGACAALVVEFVASAAVVALVDGQEVVGAPPGTAAERLVANDGWWRATLADGRPRIPADFAGFPDELAEQARAEGFRSARVTPLTAPDTGEVIGCVALWMRLAVEPGTIVHGVRRAERLATLVIGEQRRQHALRREAATDPLTGVGNRSALRRALDGADRADRADGACGAVTVALVDLDDFKRVNDAHGHAAGDAVLQVTAQRLVEAIGERHLVVRFGGDEFAVVFACGTPAGEAAAAGARAAEAIRAPIPLCDGVTLRIGASVGVASGAAGDVIRLADAVLYEAKERNRPPGT